MKKINEYIKTYKYPKQYKNPNLEDIIDFNNLNNEDLSFYDIKILEGLLWHDKRGPKYDIYCENRIYENINHSYSSKELLKKINSKFKDYIYDSSEVDTNSKNNKSFGLYINNDELIKNEEFKSLLNYYNYYISFCEKRKGYWELYIEPYKPEEKTDYIYKDCKGIVYRIVNDNGLKRLNHHGLVPRHDIDRYYPKYIFVVANSNKDKLKETLKLVQNDIKKTNLHIIQIDLNKYENKLNFYIDTASVNYDAYITREYIPKYCCKEININDI